MSVWAREKGCGLNRDTLSYGTHRSIVIVEMTSTTFLPVSLPLTAIDQPGGIFFNLIGCKKLHLYGNAGIFDDLTFSFEVNYLKSIFSENHLPIDCKYLRVVSKRLVQIVVFTKLDFMAKISSARVDDIDFKQIRQETGLSKRSPTQ